MIRSSLLGLLIKKTSKQAQQSEIENINEKELPEPGIDPGSLEPQSNILPLNYSGFLIK